MKMTRTDPNARISLWMKATSQIRVANRLEVWSDMWMIFQGEESVLGLSFPVILRWLVRICQWSHKIPPQKLHGTDLFTLEWERSIQFKLKYRNHQKSVNIATCLHKNTHNQKQREKNAFAVLVLMEGYWTEKKQ